MKRVTEEAVRPQASIIVNLTSYLRTDSVSDRKPLRTEGVRLRWVYILSYYHTAVIL